jgi:hypothetical protein
VHKYSILSFTKAAQNIYVIPVSLKLTHCSHSAKLMELLCLHRKKTKERAQAEAAIVCWTTCDTERKQRQRNVMIDFWIFMVFSTP